MHHAQTQPKSTRCVKRSRIDMKDLVHLREHQSPTEQRPNQRADPLYGQVLGAVTGVNQLVVTLNSH